MVKHWSNDQGNVAKSSGEAELYAANYGADHRLGLQSILKEMGVRVQVEVVKGQVEVGKAWVVVEMAVAVVGRAVVAVVREPEEVVRVQAEAVKA